MIATRTYRRTVVELTLDTRTQGDWTVVDVGGEVDLSSAPALRAELEMAIARPTRGVVVDLTGVGFMDSSGLSVLVAGLKIARESGGDLAVVCRNESILKVLTVTGLDRLFAVHGSVGEATAT